MIHQLMSLLDTFTTGIIDSLGHWGIFITMTLESACIPLPSEVIMLFGGFLAAQGILSFWWVVVAGVLGNLFGSIIAYMVGKYGGRTVLTKYGKYILFNQDHMMKSEAFFARYGSWATFFGRMLPVIRTFISLPAGISQMNFKKFTIFTLLGCIPWNILLTYLGVKLGQHWEDAQPYLKPLTIIGALIVLAIVFWYVYKNIKTRKNVNK